MIVFFGHVLDGQRSRAAPSPGSALAKAQEARAVS